jgi:hypothetical protein
VRRLASGDGAQAIILIAIVLSALLLGVGLAVDTGQLYVARRAAQTAADSAAWAGAVVIHAGGTAGYSAATATSAESAAITDAGRNGYTIDAADVNVPPASGPAAGDAGFVEVILTTQVPTFFFPGPRAVTVRAVGGASRTGSGEAFHVIDPSAQDALELTGAGRVFVTNGSVFVRSTDGRSLRIDSPTGGFGITTPATMRTRTRGEIDSGDVAKITPTATQLAADVPDPLAGLPTPRTVGCDPAAPLAACTSFAAPSTGGVKTINPGIYPSIDITSGTTTLNPGAYIVRGSFSVSGSGSVAMASGTAGVLIFLTHSAYPAAGSTCGAIALSSTASVTLRPRSTGSYAGIVIFQDRVCTNTMEWSGSGARSITGTIYVPVASRPAFRITGSITVGLTGQVIVSTFEGADMRLDLAYDRASVAGGRAPVLIE